MRSFNVGERSKSLFLSQHCYGALWVFFYKYVVELATQFCLKSLLHSSLLHVIISQAKYHGTNDTMKFQLLALLAGAAWASEAPTLVKRQNATAPANACTTFQTPTIPGVTIVSIQGAERRGVVVNTTMMTDNGPQPVPALDICDVNVTLSHGTSGDRVRVEVCTYMSSPFQCWTSCYDVFVSFSTHVVASFRFGA